MNSNIKIVLIFSAGVATGVAASWRFLKKKYEQIAQEEIDSVKETFEREYVEPKEDAEKKEYKELTEMYTGDSVKVEDDDGGPRIIAPEEFGDVDEYDTTTLYYYTDGVLVDLQDNIIEDVDGTVGADFAEHFGEYEDDSVCVRNDAHKCDYEILRELRSYADVKKPTLPLEAEE